MRKDGKNNKTRKENCQRNQLETLQQTREINRNYSRGDRNSIQQNL